MKKIQDFRILFMGTPEIAATTFENLIKEGFNFIGLIAQEDKPIGRKAILEPVPTKVVALKHSIPVYQPHKIRLDYDFVKQIKPDLILTMAYGQIIPQGLIDIPTFGCLNLHGSLLPKYRGAAPIQRCLINGDKVTGITLMEMIDKMDAGKMYDKEEVVIESDDNYSSLIAKLSIAATKLCIRSLPLYLNGELKGIEQDETLVTIANKIKSEDEKLDLNKNCEETINYIRGLSDEPGAYLMLDDKKIKIYKAHKVSSDIGIIGMLSIKKDVYLQLKDGVIQLDVVQLEGKKKMDGRSFANGNHHFDKLICK